MLSVLCNNRFRSMAADELSSSDSGGNRFQRGDSYYRNNIKRIGGIDCFSAVDGMMGNLDFVVHRSNSSNRSDDLQLLEDEDEDDEISVGCPSPPLSLSNSNNNNNNNNNNNVGLLEAKVRSNPRSDDCPSSVSSAAGSPPASSVIDTADMTRDHHRFTYSRNNDDNDSYEERNNSLGEEEIEEDDDDSGNVNKQEEGLTTSSSRTDEYFKPLKKLKMMKIDKTRFSINERNKNNAGNGNNNPNRRFHRKPTMMSSHHRPLLNDSPSLSAGVKSFSICDILSHKSDNELLPPSTSSVANYSTNALTIGTALAGGSCSSNGSSTSSSVKIVRPWDSTGPPPQVQSVEGLPSSSCSATTTTIPYLLPPPAHRGGGAACLLPPQAGPIFFGHFHPQQLAAALHLHRPKSEDIISSTYESCSSSNSTSEERSSSECCTSPDVLNCSLHQNSASSAAAAIVVRQNRHHSSSPSTVTLSSSSPSSQKLKEHHHHHHHRHHHHHQQQSNRHHKSSSGKQANSSPLDALFQMTNKTFDELNGESGTEGANHLNLFNNRQQPKKKRKSRTAFTNHQIFELERRFIYQKYLSPADRDEIAAQLGLSNAQVITWFQNRRAKMKRDIEELKKDVETSKVLTQHNTFLENVQNLGILKKKPTATSTVANNNHNNNNNSNNNPVLIGHHSNECKNSSSESEK